MSIRVFIADDHPIVRAGLRLTIERSGKDIVIVGEASDGLEVIAFSKTDSADIFILDITMPNLNGIEAARMLLTRRPAAKIIMLSLHDAKALVEESLKAGARGYLTKETATQNVFEAVMAVYAGRRYLCPMVAHYAIREDLLKYKAKRKRGELQVGLTPQETRVLQLIAEGQSNKEIAARLNLSINTIRVHRNNAMAKLNIHKQADLVRYALKAGIAKL